MFNISQFLEKFAKLRKGNDYLKGALKAIVKEASGVNLKTEEIELKEEMVYLKCSPIFRNQIFMYKDKIEDKLKEQKIFLKIF